jgi:cystathionine beta-synthase
MQYNKLIVLTIILIIRNKYPYFRAMQRLIDTIGETPMIQLHNFGSEYPVRIYAKLEYFNPTCSLKDRIALFLIEQAEASGIIKPGDTLIENSSGNTATGLAMIAKQKGYKLILVVRDTLSPDKRRVLDTFGVEIIAVDATLDAESPYSYNRYARTYANEHEGVWFVDQHDNLDNFEAHYRFTGKEIARQTEGELDYFIGSMGTGGTLSGIGKALKEANPNTKIIGVDPVGSVFRDYFYENPLPKPHGHHLEGIGNALPTKNVVREFIDEVMEIRDIEGLQMVRRLVKDEGIIAGPSAGANLWGVLQIAEREQRELAIGTIIGDTGYKYTSTLFDDEWLNGVV